MTVLGLLRSLVTSSLFLLTTKSKTEVAFMHLILLVHKTMHERIDQ